MENHTSIIRNPCFYHISNRQVWNSKYRFSLLTSSTDLIRVFICISPGLPSIICRRIWVNCKVNEQCFSYVFTQGGLVKDQVVNKTLHFNVQLTSSLLPSSTSASRKSRVTGSGRLRGWEESSRYLISLSKERKTHLLTTQWPHVSHLRLKVRMEEKISIWIDGKYVSVGSKL